MAYDPEATCLDIGPPSQNRSRANVARSMRREKRPWGETHLYW